MGNQPTTAKQELREVRNRLGEQLGIEVTGRYHSLPRHLEDDYEVADQELGQGYNGSVFLARSKVTGQQFAVKPFKLFRISKAKKRELRNEVEIFLSMDHPHVARLKDVYEDDTQLRIVMECLSGGELFDRITKERRFTERDAAETSFQILLAVNYLHSKNIVHRDIKCENFLYSAKGGQHLKLIDFGFSRFCNNSRKMQLSCGTLAYVAPEVLTKDYTSKCDLWSVGVVVFILLMGYMPFSGSNDEELIAKIKEGECHIQDGPWSRLSDSAKDFLMSLLKVDPARRFSAEQALEHSWIARRESLPPSAEMLDSAIVDSLCQFTKASRFRKACMSLMAWSLSNEEREQVREAFLAIDQDQKGTISLSELKSVLEANCKVTDAEVRNIFNAMDTHHSEEIHYSDFLAAMMSSRITMHDSLIKDTFNRLDQDGSGFITVADLRKVLGDCYEGEQADKLLKEVDLSQDGKISMEEFMSYIIGGDARDEHQEAAEKVIESELVRRSVASAASPPGEGQSRPSTCGRTEAPAPKSRACLLL